MAQELRSQYLLAFAPEILDGKVHKLEVRVKRPGVTVRARRSYSAVAETPPPARRRADPYMETPGHDTTTWCVPGRVADARGARVGVETRGSAPAYRSAIESSSVASSSVATTGSAVSEKFQVSHAKHGSRPPV